MSRDRSQVINRSVVRKRGWLPRRIGTYLLMTLIGIPFVFPVYWMFVTGLKSLGAVFQNPPVLWPSHPGWGNYLSALTQGDFLQNYWNSTYIAVVSTAGILAVSSLAGYAFARIEFKGRNALFVLLLSALFVPVEDRMKKLLGAAIHRV